MNLFPIMTGDMNKTKAFKPKKKVASVPKTQTLLELAREYSEYVKTKNP